MLWPRMSVSADRWQSCTDLVKTDGLLDKCRCGPIWLSLFFFLFLFQKSRFVDTVQTPSSDCPWQNYQWNIKMAVISECRNHSDGDSVVLGSTLVIPECRNHSGGDSVVLGSTLVISECRNYSGGDSVVLDGTLVISECRDLNAVRRAQWASMNRLYIYNIHFPSPLEPSRNRECGCPSDRRVDNGHAVTQFVSREVSK